MTTISAPDLRLRINAIRDELQCLIDEIDVHGGEDAPDTDRILRCEFAMGDKPDVQRRRRDEREAAWTPEMRAFFAAAKGVR